MTHSGTLLMMGAAMESVAIGAAELKELVTRRARLDREFLVTSLPRLAALAPDVPVQAETLNASLVFQPGAEGYPQVHLRVSGSVPLVCQRCLGPLRHSVGLDEVLTVVGADAEAAGLADPFQTVLMTGDALVPGQVVEDEVLAALPLSPRHADTRQCLPAMSGAGIMDPAATGETHRPLASLRELMGRGGSQRDD